MEHTYRLTQKVECTYRLTQKVEHIQTQKVEHTYRLTQKVEQTDTESGARIVRHRHKHTLGQYCQAHAQGNTYNTQRRA